jgi:hypothetical protein
MFSLALVNHCVKLGYLQTVIDDMVDDSRGVDHKYGVEIEGGHLNG